MQAFLTFFNDSFMEAGNVLRTVPPFVTARKSAHLGSGSRYSSFLRNLPTINAKVFLRGL